MMHTLYCGIGAASIADRKSELRRFIAFAPKTGKRAFGNKRTATHTHQGIDLGMPRGTDVWSLVDGTVTHASDKLAEGFSGYGRHVVVRQGDDGPWFLYGHLDTVDVEPGDEVEFGQSLGGAGDSCFNKSDPTLQCKGVHVHGEVSPTRYPQASEAPRLDPVQWARDEIALLDSADPVEEPPAPKPAKAKKKRRRLRGSGALVAVVVSLLAVATAFVAAKRL